MNDLCRKFRSIVLITILVVLILGKFDLDAQGERLLLLLVKELFRSELRRLIRLNLVLKC